MEQKNKEIRSAKDYYHSPTDNRIEQPSSVKMEWNWARDRAEEESAYPDELMPSTIRVLSHPGGATPVHKHDFFELIYVFSGTAENRVHQKMIPLSTGDMCLMNTNALHSLSAAPGTIIFNLLINTELLESSVFSLIRSNDLIASFFVESIHGIYTSEDYIVFRANGNEEARDLLESMIREYNEHQIYYTTVMQAQLVWLFACLGRSFQKTQIQLESGSYGPTIAAIIEYMSENCMTATLDSVASYFHYNPSYFSRMIKRITNNNFSDILLRFRLENAAHFLSESQMQVQEIAAKIGFGSSSAFSTAFKKHYGTSPADYRRKQRQK